MWIFRTKIMLLNRCQGCVSYYEMSHTMHIVTDIFRGLQLKSGHLVVQTCQNV